MAKLDIALELTLKNEGFYSNDPSDTGGETLWGIARNKEKNWAGWPIVDSLKNSSNFPNCLKNNAQLIQMRNDVYNTGYWKPIKGDDIINQEVANDLFDKAVNMGVRQAIVLCQRSLEIPETGKMDTGTLNVLNTNNPFA
jgi:hypothetical protein